MKKIIFLLLILLPLGVLSAGGVRENWKNTQQWEKWAKLGNYQTEKDNWQAIRRAAKREGTIKIYTSYPCITEAATAFGDYYDIEVIIVSGTAYEIMDRLQREQDSSNFEADIVLIDGIERVYNEFYDYGRLIKYVPAEASRNMSDRVADAPLGIPFSDQLGIICLSDDLNEIDIDSWWDLTRDEWRGKFVIQNPYESEVYFSLVAAFIQNYVEVEEAYQDEFGFEIIKSDEMPNPGYSLVNEIYANQPVVVNDSAALLNALQSQGAECRVAVGEFKRIEFLSGYCDEIELLSKIKPKSSLNIDVSSAVGVFAKHPNSAKLFSAWLYGLVEEAGFEYPLSFLDKPLSQGKYFEDPDWLYENYQQLMTSMEKILQYNVK